MILDDLVKAHAPKVVFQWNNVVKGFALQMTERQALAISDDPRVRLVQEDAQLIASQAVARNWNVDRVDNRMPPRLDGYYNYATTGSGVFAYVVDTGVWAGHDEFSNPDPMTGGPRVRLGWDYKNALNSANPNKSNDPCVRDASDLSGSHGTAVASVLGGRSLGTAPNVTIVPVRMGDCGGNYVTSSLIAGLNWIPNDPNYASRPIDPNTGLQRSSGRVVNLSLVAVTGDVQYDETLRDVDGLDLAVQGLLNQGITVVAAAGNYNEPVANKFSPARMSGIITVGGTKGRNDGDVDARWDNGPAGYGKPATGSNYGPKIDVFAPAANVLTAHWTTPTATRDPNSPYSSGTSFAAPLVAGVAARPLQFYPAENCAQIEARIVAGATTEAHGLDIGGRVDSPNRLLYKGKERVHACCD